MPHQPKIVVTNHQDFTDSQKQRLDSLGEVTYFDSLPNGDQYLERIAGAEIICSGTAGLKDVFAKLHNVYLTVNFVSVAFLDVNVLKSNQVTVSNAPGANRYAVSEWVVGMLILMSRQLDQFLNSQENYRRGGKLPPLTPGLAEKSITILGAGNIGRRVGEVAASLGMDVRYYQRGDNLKDSVEDADYVVNTLGSNASTKGLLDARFFDSMKAGSYFVDVTRAEIVDHDALLSALDKGHLAGAASDCGGILVGDTRDPLYRRLLDHSKVYVTPHISYNTPLSMKIGNDIMIDNVEAWINGNPQNVLT